MAVQKGPAGFFADKTIWHCCNTMDRGESKEGGALKRKSGTSPATQTKGKVACTASGELR